MSLIDAPETPDLTGSDLFPASRYTGPDVMPAGAVGCMDIGPDKRFIGLGKCHCGRDIGTIGYRTEIGGPVVCWGCHMQAMKANKTANKPTNNTANSTANKGANK